MSGTQLRTHTDIEEIPREDWDRLAAVDASPFVSWAFLSGLERTGCVHPERGWWPSHLALWHGGALRAAAPAYVKVDGMGDFSRDWSFSQALQTLGADLYPKLVVCAPFSPVTGPRLLTAPGEDRHELATTLLRFAQEVARRLELASIQVLYPAGSDLEPLEETGFATRSMIQYHWRNRGYESVDDWLASLRSRKRKQVRRERRAPAQQGIRIHTIRGEELAARRGELAPLAYELYRSTCEKYMWGGTYLNRRFFTETLFGDLAHRTELVLAERAQETVAGAINLGTGSHLYGRYWGCFEEHRFLHFNVCYYHSIEESIRLGRQVFEGGAGGEHKLHRGFEPTPVHTSHWFAAETVQRALAPALRRDSELQAAAVERWQRARGPHREAGATVSSSQDASGTEP